MSDKHIQILHQEVVRTVFGTEGYDTNDYPCYINWLGTHYAIVDRVRTFSGQFNAFMSCLSTVKTGEGYKAVIDALTIFGPELKIEKQEFV
jgi:hypothetical protein